MDKETELTIKEQLKEIAIHMTNKTKCDYGFIPQLGHRFIISPPPLSFDKPIPKDRMYIIKGKKIYPKSAIIIFEQTCINNEDIKNPHIVEIDLSNDVVVDPDIQQK